MENSNIFERIQSISDSKGFKSINDFALNGLNYSSSEKINRLKKTGKKPSYDILEDITNKFEDVDANWLLTGRGDMFREKSKLQLISGKRKTSDAIILDQEIPLYDLEATAGLQELFDTGKPQKVLDTIKIPNLPRCDGAITISGDSMYPLLKSGDMVLYKQASVESIFYGEMYLLSVKIDHWEEYVTVKYIQKSEMGDGYIKLVSQNQYHQPKDIKIDQISALALIKASIRINTML